jgi:hypothetical protein
MDAEEEWKQWLSDEAEAQSDMMNKRPQLGEWREIAAYVTKEHEHIAFYEELMSQLDALREAYGELVAGMMRVLTPVVEVMTSPEFQEGIRRLAAEAGIEKETENDDSA